MLAPYRQAPLRGAGTSSPPIETPRGLDIASAIEAVRSGSQPAMTLLRSDDRKNGCFIAFMVAPVGDIGMKLP